MSKHDKQEDLNQKPYNPDAPPELKAREFDQQYGQNRGNVKPVVPKAKGRHKK